MEASSAARAERAAYLNLIAGGLLLAFFFATGPVPERLFGTYAPFEYVWSIPLVIASGLAFSWVARELTWAEQRGLLAQGTPVIGEVIKRSPPGERSGSGRIVYRFLNGLADESGDLDAADDWLDAHGLVEGAPITVLVHPTLPWCASRPYCSLSGVRIAGFPERWSNIPSGTEVRS